MAIDNTVSIFEIPIILDLICAYLTNRDLSQCILASHSWRILFTPYRFHTLRFQDGDTLPSRFPPRFDQEGALIILQHAHWIRSLSFAVRSNLISLLLQQQPFTCQNIRRLKYHVPSSYSVPNTIPTYLDALTFIEKNTRLERLNLDGFITQNPILLARLIQVLRNHPSLVRVDLSGEMVVRRSVLRAFLNCSKKVKKLELAWSTFENEEHHFWREQSDNIDKDASLLAVEDIKRFGLQEQDTKDGDNDEEEEEQEYALEQLVCRGHFMDKVNEPSPLLTLIKKSPHLKRIHFPKMFGHVSEAIPDLIKASCPKLERISLQPDFSAKSIGALLRACRSLKDADLEGIDFWDDGVLKGLLNHAGTLQSLVISEAVEVSSMDLQLILSSCGELTKLQVLDFRDDTDPWKTLEIEDVATSEWVCLKMKDLELTFGSRTGWPPTRDTGSEKEEEEEDRSDESDDSKEGDGLEEDEVNKTPLNRAPQRGRDKEPNYSERKALLRGVYQQLGRLTKLQSLAIGWRNDERINLWDDPPSAVPYLDMSLASGLDELRNLTDMRSINLDRFFSPHGIRRPELEWMVKHWQELGSLVTVLHPLMDKEEPGWATWLRDRRPDLKVS